jgi:2-polyprenyl-6-methoxyphenol hydroxylase-like FAD-dependent oxidoreductase
VATFWIHRAPGTIDDASAAGARKALRTVYGSLGWVVPWLLQRAEELEHLYFDTVSQVELPAWSRGRVVLCGDACQAVSLIAGQGASMAMGGAWVLAEELQAAGPDIAAGLARYEKRMRPAIAVKQRAGRRMAKWFVPASSLRLTVRDALLRWSSSAAGAWVVRRELAADSVLGS